MSEKEPDTIKEGDTVVINKPKPKQGPKGSSIEPVIFLVILAVVAIFALSDSSSSPPPPTLTAGRIPAGECLPGIVVGQTVVVSADAVRVRWSPGYVTKVDTSDTLSFLEAGDRAVVRDGPQIRDGLCWWLIEHQGQQGWAADRNNEGLVLMTAAP